MYPNKFLLIVKSCKTVAKISGFTVCITVYSAECPEHLRTTKLRKHITTMSELLNLNENEIDILADYLGQDIRVHREFY